MKRLLVACLLVLPVSAASSEPSDRLDGYDRCQAVGEILVKLGASDQTLAKRGKRQAHIFRNLAFHTRRSDGVATVPAMVETVRGRIRAVKAFADQFRETQGEVPQAFRDAADACAQTYAEVATQPQPATVHLWPKWEKTDDPAYGQRCGNPVRTGGETATGKTLVTGGDGVSLSYYWISTLRDADGNPVASEHKGTGACPEQTELGIVDFWMIDGVGYVIAPYAKGMPRVLKGYRADY